MTAVHLGIGYALLKDPAEVSVDEALGRAMRITFAVGLGMVFGVGGGPLDCWTLEGHRAENEQHQLDRRMWSKAAMGEHTVEPDRYAQRDKGVHHGKQDEVGRVDEALPEETNGEQGSKEGDDHHSQDHGPEHNLMEPRGRCVRRIERHRTSAL